MIDKKTYQSTWVPLKFTESAETSNNSAPNPEWKTVAVTVGCGPGVSISLKSTINVTFFSDYSTHLANCEFFKVPSSLATKPKKIDQLYYLIAMEVLSDMITVVRFTENIRAH
jgi:hypothetical protein